METLLSEKNNGLPGDYPTPTYLHNILSGEEQLSIVSMLYSIKLSFSFILLTDEMYI